MRIALVAPLYEAVPPRLYGGTERIVAYLADELTTQGHDVTLFASAESETRAKLVACRDRALRLDPDLKSDLAAHLAMLHEVRQRIDEFDIVHFHIDCLPCAVFSDAAERTVTTLHGRLDIADLPALYRRFDRFPLVSISRDQRRYLPDANWIGTVHHGLPPDLYPFVPFPQGDYVAFLGRISPEKRPDRAIEIAKRAGVRLKIAAKVDPADRSYFEERIKPMLDHPLIDFIGEIGEAEKAAFLGNAAALLFPIDWPEPFGLVVIEAMACGTPVVAFRQGSVPEVVEDGVTGLIVDGIDGAVEAVRQVRRLNRLGVRKGFERRFTTNAMANAYLGIYASLMAARPGANSALGGDPA